MSNVWFTADQHFDHDGIVELCKRPFKSTRHMNKELIRNYNYYVEDDDTVYFLGDLCLKSSSYLPYYNQLLSQLNGQKHLIIGNHDNLKWDQYIEAGFTSIHSSLIINTDKRKLILNHDPAPSCINRDDIWLCGHVHDLFRVCNNVVNVGVDVWDYKPVSLDRIEKLIGNGI